MPAHDPVQRKLIAQHAAFKRWSRESGKAAAMRAQDGLLRKFFNETDPDLPEAERWRRAECARRAHMIALSRKAAALRQEARNAA